MIPVAGKWWQTQFWLFGAFALAFAIKVPMVPLHTWLPDAHVEAPTAGSVVLAGVLLKMGTYGFLRFALPLFPAAVADWTPTVLVLSVIGIVYGSLVAMVQEDIKKLVAYSSVAHLGFVMLGMFALNVQGATGSVLQMINHGLSTGALFLLVGMLYERRHTRLVTAFGGVAKPMPVFAFFFGLVTMSSIGLPMLNGFVGEFLILLGAFLAHPWYAVVAASGVVLAAAYMLWMFRRVMFGPVDNPENRKLIDLDWRETIVLVSISIPIVWIGVNPDPLLRRIEPSVSALLQDVHARAAIAAPAPPGRGRARARRRSAREPAGAQSLGARPGRGGRHGRDVRADRRGDALAPEDVPRPAALRVVHRQRARAACRWPRSCWPPTWPPTSRARAPRWSSTSAIRCSSSIRSRRSSRR